MSFVDVDFTFAAFPFAGFTMGQTNYRIYIIDQETGERAAWFLGTTLDSWTVAVPRYLWKLPWYPGRVLFDCDLDNDRGVYRRYRMSTASEWASVELELTQTESMELHLDGFPDIETGLFYLTHPLTGFYHRRDGKLGSYRVWHDLLVMRPAQVTSASFGLLDRLGIVPSAQQKYPHSVMVQPLNEFTIYLPPKVIT